PPDAEWLPAVLVLIFAVPTGAFLSLYALIACFLFRSSREAVPVAVLVVLALNVNGLALVFLVDSLYSGGRYLAVPIAALTGALAAGAVTTYRAGRGMAGAWPD